MKKDEVYKNGQRVSTQTGEIKAQGRFIDGYMEGEWIFNKKPGYLWQRGNFVNNEKHGEWIRYDKDGAIVYHAVFADGKLSRKIPLS